jgi:glycosyltransferase involved in cell wall biosynthesis
MDLDRPKIAHEPITVVLPCRNQEAGLPSILDAWIRSLTKLREFELIVVDDGSTDGSHEIASRFALTSTFVRLLRHDEPKGVGACLRSAMLFAQHPLVATVSCDYPYQPGDLKKLLDAIDRADLVSGCRTEPIPSGLLRLGRIYRTAVRILFGIPLEPRPGWRGWSAWRRAVCDRWVYGVRLWDAGSAFKLFRKSVIERIPIQSDGDFVHVELMAKANFLGCVMAEVPIGRLGSSFKGVIEPRLRTESGDRRRVFRKPRFTPETRQSDVSVHVADRNHEPQPR